MNERRVALAVMVLLSGCGVAARDFGGEVPFGSGPWLTNVPPTEQANAATGADLEVDGENLRFVPHVEPESWDWANYLLVPYNLVALLPSAVVAYFPPLFAFSGATLRVDLYGDTGHLGAARSELHHLTIGAIGYRGFADLQRPKTPDTEAAVRFLVADLKRRRKIGDSR